MRLCLVDTGIFLCLAFEDPGYQECGKLLDQVFKGDFDLLMSSLQLTELFTPFLRAGDTHGLRVMKQEIAKLEPKIRGVNREIAEKAAEFRSIIRTPSGRWLALADSVILSTAVVEKAETLYTIDPDFVNAQQVQVTAPQMKIKDWIKLYGTDKQRKMLQL